MFKINSQAQPLVSEAQNAVCKTDSATLVAGQDTTYAPIGWTIVDTFIEPTKEMLLIDISRPFDTNSTEANAFAWLPSPEQNQTL